jgi:hypothetical protein
MALAISPTDSERAVNHLVLATTVKDARGTLVLMFPGVPGGLEVLTHTSSSPLKLKTS